MKIYIQNKMNQLILAVILTILPISELRGGMPLAVDYALKNNISVFLIFLLILVMNILVIFIVFLFLDFFHKKFLNIKIYEKFFNIYLNRLRKKADKIEKDYSAYGFLALTLFVAVPIPTTGAWTGTIIAWLLGLDRKKSIISITLGVLIAAIVVFLASLGIINLFNA